MEILDHMVVLTDTTVSPTTRQDTVFVLARTPAGQTVCKKGPVDIFASLAEVGCAAIWAASCGEVLSEKFARENFNVRANARFDRACDLTDDLVKHFELEDI